MKKNKLFPLMALMLLFSACSICKFTSKQAYCLPDGNCVVEGCVECKANVRDASKIVFQHIKIK